MQSINTKQQKKHSQYNLYSLNNLKNIETNAKALKFY